MDTDTSSSERLTDLRLKSTLGVAIIALVILTPFSINNFFQGRFLLGAGSLAVVILVAINAWNCFRQRYKPALIFWGLAPVTTLFLVLALNVQGMMVTYWAYPAVLSFYFMLPKKRAWIANLVFLAFILPQAWLILEPSFMLRFAFTMVAVSGFSALFVQVIADQQTALEQQIVSDPLTGLLNRMLLNDVLEQTIHQNDRNQTPMTIIGLDIDHFKDINDTLGHAAGDKVLQDIAVFFKTRVRRADKVFRLGGEEFLILLYDTDAAAGKQVAESICRGIASLSLLPDREVTVSAGVATLESSEPWDSWMKRCDDKLYQAKRDGRNQVKA